MVKSRLSFIGWNSRKHGLCTVHFVGREKTVQDFLGLVPESGPLDKGTLKQGLLKLKGNFAAIVEAPDFTLAVADKIRGYPVFYAHQGGNFRVSNSARLLKEEIGLTEANELSLLEFRMAGYVTGRDTLYKGLYQLQAGEFLVWDKTKHKLDCERYYIFYSNEIRKEKQDDFIQELDGITNAIIQRNMDDAAGRPIWVPLSGGLDSRLILCKLKQLGYDNLHAFSYGMPGNFEAKAARHVAEKLNVPWRFVPSTRRESREFFKSEQRKGYWNFADGLCLPPTLHTFLPLLTLINDKYLPRHSVLINGQSGDFIAGQHIPDLEGRQPNHDILTEKIIAKHFSHKADFLAGANRRAVSEKILNTLRLLIPAKIGDYQEFAKQYELWEWQERQCKRVINGQRNYDFFNLSWELPLWDIEYLKFWSEIPVSLKVNRLLFSNYVEKMDFFGLFKNFKPFMCRWPQSLVLVQCVGNVIKILFGEDVSKKYYRLFDYWSNYSSLYAQTPFSTYIHSCQKNMSPISFYTDTWIEENVSIKT